MKHVVITKRVRVHYSNPVWGNRPMTLGRLLREAPFTEEELAEKEARRKKMLAILLSKKDTFQGFMGEL